MTADNASFPPLRGNSDRIALVEGERSYRYAEVNAGIQRCARGLLAGADDLREERIALFLPASLDYVTAMHGIWRAGGIAVPLNVASAVAELDHYLGNAGVSRLIANASDHAALTPLCERLNVELITPGDVLADETADDRAVEGLESAAGLPGVDEQRRAMILFTSGTTSKPKGVVSTHATLRAQVITLLDAWEWSEDDVIPLFLPVHHVHGIVNILSCGLWAGATVHLFGRFDPERICEQVGNRVYSVFMAVPTIYVKLLQYLDTLEPAEPQSIADGFAAMRLNISGSAACPVPIFEQWQQLTGQVLLERYGMTEIGMALSNPYHGERRAGFVGQPLPGVGVQLFDDGDQPITGEGVAGEIRVRGDSVFLEYWDNPEATRDSFRDGWFCTGDVAMVSDGYYRIMGRSSVDIIKSGGYKLSALEIEGVLLTHPAISEVAVIGVADETWGEAVTAFIVLREAGSLDYEDLKRWCEGRISAYKIPKAIRVVDALPRNAMGKVTKPALKDLA